MVHHPCSNTTKTKTTHKSCKCNINIRKKFELLGKVDEAVTMTTHLTVAAGAESSAGLTARMVVVVTVWRLLRATELRLVAELAPGRTVAGARRTTARSVRRVVAVWTTTLLTFAGIAISVVASWITCTNPRLYSSCIIAKPRVDNESLILSLLVEARGWAVDRVHNSRRPLDRLFTLCDPVTTFDLLT